MAKRKLVPPGESPETPLAELINFGPVTTKELKSMGLNRLGQLQELGWEEVCRRWVETYPQRLNLNAFVGVIATLEGVPWTKISSADKSRAARLVKELRMELGLKTKNPIRKGKRKGG